MEGRRAACVITIVAFLAACGSPARPPRAPAPLAARDDRAPAVAPESDPAPRAACEPPTGPTLGVASTFACAIELGSLFCWGDLRWAVPDVGATQMARIEAPPDLRAISVALDRICVLDARCAVHCAGVSARGIVSESPQPFGPVEGLPPARAISVGREVACALDEAGTAWSWGTSRAQPHRSAPSDETRRGRAPIPEPEAARPAVLARGVRALDCARALCVIDGGGSLACARRGWSPWEAMLQPVPAPDPWLLVPGGPFVAVRSSYLSLDALAEDGSLWSTSAPPASGDLEATPGARPLAPFDPVIHARSLGAGPSCAVIEGGTAACWGFNRTGATGHDLDLEWAPPASVPGLSDVSEIASNGSTTCARRGDGSIACWGARLPTMQPGPYAFEPADWLRGAQSVVLAERATCGVDRGRARCEGTRHSFPLPFDAPAGPLRVGHEIRTIVVDPVDALGCAIGRRRATCSAHGIRIAALERAWSSTEHAVLQAVSPPGWIGCATIGRVMRCATIDRAGLVELAPAIQLDARAVGLVGMGFGVCALLAGGRVACARHSEPSTYCGSSPCASWRLLGGDGPAWTSARAISGWATTVCALLDGGVIECWAQGRAAVHVGDVRGAPAIALADGILWIAHADGSLEGRRDPFWSLPEGGIDVPPPGVIVGVSNVVELSEGSGICAHEGDGDVLCSTWRAHAHESVDERPQPVTLPR